MRKESHQKNVKIHMRVIALFLCALIFSSCTNCASCNFADLFNIEIIPDASEKENASGIEGSSDEEKHTHTHSEMPTEKQTELPTEEPTEESPTYDESVLEGIEKIYFDTIAQDVPSYREKPYPAQMISRLGDRYVVYVRDPKRIKHLAAIDINGYEFRYHRYNEIYVVHNGKFTTLPDALQNGSVTDEELEKIHVDFRALYADEYKEYSKATIESDFSPEIISVSVQPDYSDKEYTVEDFSEILDIVTISHIKSNDFRELSGDIGKFLWIYLDNSTKEDTLEAVMRLQDREDFIGVDVSYFGYADAATNDH